MNPPIRNEKDVKYLRELFYNGEIPIIASDHAPHLLVEKQNLVAGAPAIQEMYPLLIDLFLKDKIEKKIMLNMIHDNPRKLVEEIGLHLATGSIKIDPHAITEFNKKSIRSKCQWSLWENIRLTGKIIRMD
jgi:dihydroorotase